MAQPCRPEGGHQGAPQRSGPRATAVWLANDEIRRGGLPAALRRLVGGSEKVGALHWPVGLFMHLPSSMAAGSIRKCRSVGNATEAAAAASGVVGTSTPWHRQQQPFIMAHLAGVRTGAWSRRALMRAYGWWHVAADDLIARQLGWNRRPHGTLVLLPAGGSGLRSSEDVHEQRTLMGKTITSLARLDVLVANLLLIGSLSGRRVVIPELPCQFAAVSTHRGYGTRPVGARAALEAEQSCAWMPPKECWAAEYTTQLEYERERQAEGATQAGATQVGATQAGAAMAGAAQQPAAAGHAEGRAEGGRRLESAESAENEKRVRGHPAEKRRAARLLGSGGKSGGGKNGGGKAWEVPRALAAARALAQQGAGAGVDEATRCEDAGRLLAHGLTLAANRASSRNATLSALKRRLRELPCDTRDTLAVLPTAAAAKLAPISRSCSMARAQLAVGSSRLVALVALVALVVLPARRRQVSQMLFLELLARVPLMRHPSRMLGLGGDLGKAMRLSNTTRGLYGGSRTVSRRCTSTLLRRRRLQTQRPSCHAACS